MRRFVVFESLNNSAVEMDLLKESPNPPALSKRTHFSGVSLEFQFSRLSLVGEKSGLFTTILNQIELSGWCLASNKCFLDVTGYLFRVFVDAKKNYRALHELGSEAIS